MARQARVRDGQPAAPGHGLAGRAGLTRHGHDAKGTVIHHDVAHGPLCHPDGSTTFRLWAPHAERVDVVLGDEAVAMESGERGWFRVRAAAAPGDDYGFRLDGGEVLPDPASRHQPSGVHGRSRLVDPSAFPWSAGEAGWRAPPLSAAAVYELHVGTFTAAGTFDAAVEHLGALADLGVTHVEVLPVNAFNGERGWGYDGVAWYAVHEPYGGPEAFARFVDACHRAGLAVVVDVVYNHLGPSGNYLPEFGPYLTDRYVTPWGDALNLDGPGSDAVRAFIVANAVAWLRDYRADALRLDAVHGLVDISAVHILRALADAVGRESVRQGRPLQLIAESDRADPLTVTAAEAGGTGMDGQWADDLHHAIHRSVTDESDGYYADYAGLPDVAEVYRRGFLFDGSRYSTYQGRTVGAPLGDVPGHRLVTCIQNHDQIGNRALGERLTTLVGDDLVRVAAVLLCASPTTPMLFMGEEYGETSPFLYFSDHPEAELAEAVRTGRRGEFAAFAAFIHAEVPDPQSADTFARSRLDRSAADTVAGRARRALWADALALRRAEPALGNGRRDLVDVLDVGPERLALLRRDADGPPVLLAVNLATGPASWPEPAGRPWWRCLLSTADPRYGGDAPPPAGASHLEVPARTATLWRGE